MCKKAEAVRLFTEQYTIKPLDYHCFVQFETCSLSMMERKKQVNLVHGRKTVWSEIVVLTIEHLFFNVFLRDGQCKHLCFEVG